MRGNVRQIPEEGGLFGNSRGIGYVRGGNVGEEVAISVGKRCC